MIIAMIRTKSLASAILFFSPLSKNSQTHNNLLEFYLCLFFTTMTLSKHMLTTAMALIMNNVFKFDILPSAATDMLAENTEIVI